jgi:Alpha amylase, catalytic domain
LHQCIAQQPDLNYRNPNVVNEMKNVLLFWLDKGIDGFRIDAIPYIYETSPNADGSYPDEPASGLTNDTTSIDYTNRMYTKDLIKRKICASLSVFFSYFVCVHARSSCQCNLQILSFHAFHA